MRSCSREGHRHNWAHCARTIVIRWYDRRVYCPAIQRRKCATAKAKKDPQNIVVKILGKQLEKRLSSEINAAEIKVKAPQQNLRCARIKVGNENRYLLPLQRSTHFYFYKSLLTNAFWYIRLWFYIHVFFLYCIFIYNISTACINANDPTSNGVLNFTAT